MVAADEVRSAGFARRVAVRMHLMMCHNCRRFAREVDLLGRVLRSLPPEDLERADETDAVERVMRRLQQPPPGP
ncbi:MAG: anti-sigma factor [Gemmatimonadaceae bacterium]